MKTNTSAALWLSSPAGILKFFRVCYCSSSVYLVLPNWKSISLKMILDAKVYFKLKPILDTYGSLRTDVSFVALGKGRLPSLLPRTAVFQYVLVATAAWKNQILRYNLQHFFLKRCRQRIFQTNMSNLCSSKDPIVLSPAIQPRRCRHKRLFLFVQNLFKMNILRARLNTISVVVFFRVKQKK